MSSAFNKFNLTGQDWLNGLVDYSADIFKVILTNTVPVATNHVYSDVSGGELVTGGGYIHGGALVGMSLANVAGVETVTVTIPNPTWVGVSGGFGPWRYAVFYDMVGIQSLQGWYDLGSSQLLGNGGFIALEPVSSFFTLT